LVFMVGIDGLRWWVVGMRKGQGAGQGGSLGSV